MKKFVCVCCQHNVPVGLSHKSSGTLMVQEENIRIDSDIRKRDSGMKLQRVVVESPSVSVNNDSFT